MVSQADLERTLALALDELAPAWKIIGDCAPVDPFDPSHWDSGSRSVLVTLRHRVTGHLTILGRRVAHEPNASLHPAVALSLIEAYRRGNPEPVRRYLEEVGVATTTAGDGATFFQRPSIVGSPAASVAANGAAAASCASPSRHSRDRMLRRLRRELVIWHWRRSAPSADLGHARARRRD
jgi:hypothetical protein